MPRSLTWRDADIKCPFFLAENEKNKTITCEGMFKNSSQTTKYRTTRERERQLVCRCEAKFEDCEQFRSVMHFKYPQ